MTFTPPAIRTDVPAPRRDKRGGYGSWRSRRDTKSFWLASIPSGASWFCDNNIEVHSWRNIAEHKKIAIITRKEETGGYWIWKT